MVDRTEGKDLEFIPTNTINGVKRAKLEKDVEAEIEYWQQAVLSSVLGAKPSFRSDQMFYQQNLGFLDIDKIIHVRNGIFLVRFWESAP